MSFVIILRRAGVPLLFLLFASGLIAAVSPARAAADDCILDHCADKRPVPKSGGGAEDKAAPAGVAGGMVTGKFDFYVLALSWSPGFCDINDQRHDQCEPGRGLGFVVHGLWPQNDRGYPSDCPGASSPSRIALEKAAGLFPDERLARHEWRKHGTCSGRSPSDYFADVARARGMVTVPPLFEKPDRDQSFAPLDVERAFFAANPRLRPGMMTVGCRRGVMEEVRICISKDLREFRACPEVVERGCHAREVSVPAPL